MLVSYDIATTTPLGKRRARKVMRACKSYGVRVQYSVFECSVGDLEWVKLRNLILDAMDKAEDSVRIYFISEDDARKTEHYGVREPIDPEGTLIV